MLIFNLLAALLLIMLLVVLWPTFIAWQRQPTKVQPGDWAAALMPLMAVVGIVILLISLVR